MLDNKVQVGIQLAGLRSFARNIGVYEERAVALYEEERLHLRAVAKVTRYVDVIAEKRTKEQLKEAARTEVGPDLPREKSAGR